MSSIVYNASNYIVPENSDRELDFEFGSNYTASQVGTLEYDQQLTQAHVEALQADPEYQEFTRRMGAELEDNTDLAKAYTQAFHDRRARNDKYKGEYQLQDDGHYKYTGGQQGIFRADGSIDHRLWITNRLDGLYGLVHESKFKSRPSPSNPEDPSDPVLPPTPTPGYPTPRPSGNPYTSTSLSTGAPSKSVWTDWIPILSKYFTNKAAIRKDTEQQKKIKYPLQMPNERHAIKTDAYLQRQQLEKQKQEVLARATGMQTSNIDDNMRIMNNANEIAERYSDRQAQLQSAEYQQTSDDVVKATNYNTAQRTEVANENLKALAAAHNNIINANRRKIAKTAANINNTVDSLYHDYGKWKHDQRLEASRRERTLLSSQANAELSKLQKTLSEQTDPQRWDALKDYAIELTKNPAGLTQQEIDILNRNASNPAQGLQTDATYRSLIISKLQTGTDSVSSRWRTAWEEFKKLRQSQHDAAASRVMSEYERRVAYIPTIIDNQIIDYTPGGTPSSLMRYKKGGKAQLLKAWVSSSQKAREAHDKNFNEAQKRGSEQLKDQLDALDKEQLLLLKAIFK